MVRSIQPSIGAVGAYTSGAFAFLLVLSLLSPVVLSVALDALYKGSPRRRALGRSNWFEMTQMIMVCAIGLPSLLLSVPLEYAGIPKSFAIAFATAFSVGAVLVTVKLQHKLLAAIAPQFQIKCPTCGKPIRWQEPWICAFCEEPNPKPPKILGLGSFLRGFFYNPFEGTFLEPCQSEHCGNRAPGILCPWCRSFVGLDEDKNDTAHAARFVRAGPAPPAPPPAPPQESGAEKQKRAEFEAEEKRKRDRQRVVERRRWKAEDEVWETQQNDRVRDRIRSERQRYEEERVQEREKKTPAERARAEAEHLANMEKVWSDLEREARLESDPERRNRRLEWINHLRVRYSDDD